MNTKFLRSFMILALLAIGIDQGSKYWSESTLLVRSDPMNTHIYQGSRETVFEWKAEDGSISNLMGTKSWISLQYNYVRNHGAAWGFLARVTDSVRLPVFHILTLLFCSFLVGLVFSKLAKLGPFAKVGIAFMVSGALGNLIDRVTRGYVVDLFDLKWQLFSWRYSLPVFNAADVYVIIGLFMFVISALRR